MEKKKDAMERAGEMMGTPMKDLPEMAKGFLNFISKRYGCCGEVMITAFAAYAQKVEKLSCNDPAYIVNDKEWDEYIDAF